MPYIRPTITEIKDRIEKGIEARLFSKLALLRVAILRVLARVFAGAIHGNYGYLEWLSRQLFVTTAETLFLNRHGRMWSVNRRSGSFATGKAVFTGLDGVIISPETVIQTEDGIEFATVQSGEIGDVTPGEIEILIQAVDAGDAGNITVGIVLQLISPISGVDGEVSLLASTSGGVDEEDDDSYRVRILERIQQVPAGGSCDDYVAWAKEISGVELAWCFPLNNGPGTVTTVIRASGPNPVADVALLTEVQDHIEDVRPVTATQDVKPIDSTDVFLQIKIEPRTIEIEEAVNKNLETVYLTHRPGNDILISQIRQAISQSGSSNSKIVGIEVDGLPRFIDQDILLSGLQYPVNQGTLFIDF